MINVEAEKAALGGVMLSGDIDEMNGIKSEEFYDPRHRLICSAIFALQEKTQPFDPITICDHLNSRSELENAGGHQYVSEVSCVPNSANIGAYSQIVTEAASKRKLLGLVHEFATSVSSEKTFDEVLSEIQQSLTELEPKGTQSLSMFDTCNEYVAWLDRPENQMKTGFWDVHTGGIEPGLHIIAAGTSQGKSTLALNIASSLAADGFGVGYYSYEMPRMKVMERLVSRRSKVFLNKLRDRNLNSFDYDSITKAMSVIKEQRLYIHDRVYNLDQLCASIRRGFSKGFIDCAFVDYLQLVPSNAPSREQEVARIARSLQQVAQQCGKPIFALSQLSRAHESRTNPRPRLADLRESGEIEQAAESVVFIYDESKYIDDSNRKDFVEIYSGKNRNGEQFEVVAKKRLDINLFEPYTEPIPGVSVGADYHLEK